MCTISKMTKPKLSGKGTVLLKPLLLPEFVLSFLLCFLIFLSDFFKEVGDGLAFDGTITANVTVSGFDVDLDVCDAGAVLTPVMLFLHQDVHLIHGVGRTIL